MVEIWSEVEKRDKKTPLNLSGGESCQHYH